jgi:hypothetical protein
MVDLTGGEHRVPPEEICRDGMKTVPAGGARPRATGRRARLAAQGQHIQIGRMRTGYACPRRRLRDQRGFGELAPDDRGDGYEPSERASSTAAGATNAVIGPGCRVDGLSLRAPLPGCGHPGLHPDFFP